MEQPPRYVAQEESSKMCLLQRVIYGLKQSPHVWFSKFSDLLTNFSFASYTVDPTVFTKKIEVSLIILTIYVDDIFVIRSDEVNIFATNVYL